MIVIMGSPGSGKTTFANNLQQKTENSHVISCGDLYRLNSNKKLQQAKDISTAEWIAELQRFIITALQTEIANFPGKTIIIDGLWADNLKNIDQVGPVDMIYYVNCSKEVALERLTRRRRPDDYPSRIASRVNSYFDREQRTFEMLKQMKNVKYV